MSINVGIIDQQVRGLAQRLRAELAGALDRPNLDDIAARSAAFVVLCGASWKVPEAQAIIDREQFGDRAVFEHVNHDTLVRIA